MSKRGLQILVAVCLSACLIAWLLGAFTQPKTDEAKYRDMLHSRHLFALSVSAERGPLRSLVRPFHLSRHFIRNFDAETSELLASGYLTNVFIAVSNAAGRRSQVVTRLDASVKGTDILIPHVTWFSNGVEIPCRPQDAAQLRQALAK
jgi:hypothetical protein